MDSERTTLKGRLGKDGSETQGRPSGRGAPPGTGSGTGSGRPESGPPRSAPNLVLPLGGWVAGGLSTGQTSWPTSPLSKRLGQTG